MNDRFYCLWFCIIRGLIEREQRGLGTVFEITLDALRFHLADEENQ